MDTTEKIQAIISKYALQYINVNGREGVKPMRGKPTKSDIEFIKAHKDEFNVALKPQPKVKPELTAAEKALREVNELEGRYMYLMEHGDTVDAIEAREQFFAARAEWQKAYPEEAKSLAEKAENNKVNPKLDSKNWNDAFKN